MKRPVKRVGYSRKCLACGQGGATTVFLFTQEDQLKSARFHLDCFDLFRSSRT